MVQLQTRSLQHFDSTRTSDLNNEGDNIIEGTEKLTVDTVIYKIDKRGKIIKTKG